MREFVDRRVRPNIARLVRPTRTSRVELVPELAELGLLGHAPAGLRMRRAVPPSSTASRSRSWRPATPASAPSSRCRARSRCRRSTSTAPRRRSRSGSRGWRRGEVIGCFGLTEAGAGSDPSSMTTRARREGGEWVLDGGKRWIGLASIADIAIIWAMTDEGRARVHRADRHAGVHRDADRAEAVDARVRAVRHRARRRPAAGGRPAARAPWA